jgi:hypothetical protein
MKVYENLGYLQNTMQQEARTYGPSRAGRLMYGCGEAIRLEREELNKYILDVAIVTQTLDKIKLSRSYRLLKMLRLIP